MVKALFQSKIVKMESEVNGRRGNDSEESATSAYESATALHEQITADPDEATEMYDPVTAIQGNSEDEDYFARPVTTRNFRTTPVSPSIRRLKRSVTTPLARSHTAILTSSDQIQPGGSSSSEPPTPSDLPLLNILLVEDNTINLSLLVKCVEKLSHNYTSAVHGLGAVRAYQDKSAQDIVGAASAEASADADPARPPFDVIFMDLQMPLMDGLTATREIRAFERTQLKDRNMRPAMIIALTAATSMASRQEAFSSGVDLFLGKPVPMKLLKGVLAEFQKVGREGVKGGGSVNI